MALNQALYVIFRQAFQQGLLPQRSAILEFGEANWYGDMSIDTLISDIEKMIEDSHRKEMIIATIRNSAKSEEPSTSFALAKAVYSAFFNPVRMDAIDFHGTPAALRLNLNEPIVLEQQYDVTINNGTAEHIFNIGEIFRSMHRWTKPGGLMFHESPFTGWIDHGFYTLQPTLFIDLSAANGYDLLGIFYVDIAARTVERIANRTAIKGLIAKHKAEKNTNLITVMRKGSKEAPFLFPIQGYYAGTLTPEQRKVWETDR